MGQVVRDREQRLEGVTRQEQGRVVTAKIIVIILGRDPLRSCRVRTSRAANR